jgi:hypothetical protein
MTKNIIPAVMFVASAVAMANVPFPGGVVVIMYDTTPRAPCPQSGVTVYPQRTVQYWYDGVDLSQVKTEGEQLTVTKIKMGKFLGLKSIYDAAAQLDKHEYACQYQLEFQPGDNDEMEGALSANSIKVGRLKKEGDIWYWSR